MSLVLDASLAAAWCFGDEATATTEKLLDRVIGDGATVPAHFYLEVMNVLLLAEHRGRIGPGETEKQVAFLTSLNLTEDAETAVRAWTDTVAIARRAKLIVYDAAYIELAIRTKSTLLTLDQPQAAAARRRGVTVLP